MSTSSLTILLVDDDEIDVMNVKRAFKKNNVTNTVKVAGNGLEALDMLKGTNGVTQLDPLPKVILLDINMPKMNGLEFLAEMRKDEKLKHLTVFILTTSNEDSDRFEAYNLNVAGYILKPVNFNKFVEAVKILDTYWQLIELPG